MPIYEYRCPNCGYQFEELQKLSAAPLSICPKCQQPNLEKIISKASFHLKGGGWYKTDYAAKTAEKVENSTLADKAPIATDNAIPDKAKNT